MSTTPGVVHTREVSCFCQKSCECFSPSRHAFAEVEEEVSTKPPETPIEVGQWVLVEYDTDLFPGLVTQVKRYFKALLSSETTVSGWFSHPVSNECCRGKSTALS